MKHRNWNLRLNTENVVGCASQVIKATRTLDERVAVGKHLRPGLAGSLLQTLDYMEMFYFRLDCTHPRCEGV